MTKLFLRRVLAVALVGGIFAAVALPFIGSADTVTVSTSVNSSLSYSVDNGSVSLGALDPDTPATEDTRVTVTTNNATGYVVKANFDASTYTDVLRHTDTTTYISDKTDFDGLGSCSVPATWSGYGFGFTLYAATTGKSTTCWGTGTAQGSGANKYAGFPTTATTILDVTSGPRSADTADIGYKIAVDGTQKSGSYSGPVLLTAIVD